MGKKRREEMFFPQGFVWLKASLTYEKCIGARVLHTPIFEIKNKKIEFF
jgi:hypothetical protein